MPDSKVLQIVATECKADIEDKFNQWYNDVHIPMLMKYAGLKKASRYQLAGDSKDHAKYLAFYEYESEKAQADFNTSPEFAAAMEEMQGSWKDGVIDIKWMANYNVIKTWEK
jgi:heme-degrading monooxygenase HmoA